MPTAHSRKHLFLLVAICFGAAAPAFAEYTVTGKFVYEDKEFDLNGFTGNDPARPIRFADVQIMAGGTSLAAGVTNSAGEYMVAVPGTIQQSITAVCVARSSGTPGLLLNVRVANDDFSFGDYYSVASAPVVTMGTGIVQMGTTLAPADTDAGKAFNIWDVTLDGIDFLASPQAAGRLPGAELTMTWRQTHSRPGSFYESATPKYIYVGARAAYDDTVVSHEFGHFIDDLYSKSDSPGGQHFLGDNKQDIRLSWGEGLATFLGSSIRKFKGYSRPELYLSTDGIKLSFSYEIETLTGNVTLSSKTGSTNEVAVTAALWDVTDGPSTADDSPGTDDDPLERPFSEVWKDLTVHFPGILTAGLSIEDFWIGWFAPDVDNGFPTEMQTVFDTTNGIEFVPDPQEEDNSGADAALAAIGRIPSPAPGAKVLINEIDMGRVDAVELYNAGSQEADITGWKIIALAKGYDPATFEIPSFKLTPGSFVVLSESSGEGSQSILYFETNVSWANDAEGSCALVDSSGKTMDFVRWGRSKDLPPDGGEFAGANPAAPPSGKTLARPLTLPTTGTAADWQAQSPSLGTYNFGAGELHHTFYPEGDIDYVGFSAISGAEYIVENVNLANGGAVVLEIVSGDGSTVLKSNDAADPRQSSRVVWTAPATGRYYVRARRYAAFNFAKFGSFDVRIAAHEPLTVSKSGTGRYSTVGQAISAARSGDTIEIQDSSTYPETLSITGKNLTLKAVAGESPVLDGTALAALPALSISADTVRLEGLRIRGGSPSVAVSAGSTSMLNTTVFRSSGSAESSHGVRASGPDTVLNIVNCVIASNSSAGVGLSNKASAHISNSIFAGNAGGDLVSDGTAASAVVRNSIVATGAFAGQDSNIQANPGFADLANDDFHLQAGSPGIDRADPQDAPPSDGDGIARNVDGDENGSAIPDIGAYEYLPTSLLSASAVFPQIAFGGSYRTTIVAMNPGAKDSAAQLNLVDSGGRTIPATSFRRSGQSVTLPLDALGTARLESDTPETTLTGYARLLSAVAGNGSVLFRRVDGNRVLSEAGVGAARPSKSFRIYIDNSNSAYSGYAIANPGSATANVSLKLRRTDGTAVGTPLRIAIDPGHHLAEFAIQRFSAAQAGFEGTLEFTSDQPLWAVALRYDNLEQDVFSTIPVLADDAATVLYFPQIADGGSYRSTFILMNPSGSSANATVEFFSNTGERLALPIGGTLRTTQTATIPSGGVFSFRTDGSSTTTQTGWVRVTSTAPLGGSSIFQVVSAGRILSEAGVAASPAATRFMSYVESLGYTESGLALCNPGDMPARVALRLRNGAGEIVASDTTILPPLGHIARFFTQWFPDSFAEFMGTLEVVSAAPVAGVALRYDNFLADVFATIPVVTIP
jgi:hypothetical protein